MRNRYPSPKSRQLPDSFYTSFDTISYIRKENEAAVKEGYDELLGSAVEAVGRS